MCITPNGSQVITGSESGDVKIWNLMANNNLALKKVLYNGRGIITNLSVIRIEREVLNLTYMNLK